MKTYTVTYNLTLTIEVQADSADEAERLADRELPSHCDVNCAVSCHRIATSPAQTRRFTPRSGGGRAADDHSFSAFSIRRSGMNHIADPVT